MQRLLQSKIRFNCRNNKVYFFTSGHGNESYNLIGSKRGPDFPISDHGHSNAGVSFFSVSLISFESLEKKKLFTGLGSVYIVKNCDLLSSACGLGQHFQDLGQCFTTETDLPAGK